MKIRVIFIFVSSLLLSNYAIANKKSDLILWYTKPAANWDEALPLGNGRLGAMVFGTPSVEHIQLNEGTVWGGSPNNNANPNAKTAIPEIRKLIFEGKYGDAQRLADEKVMSHTNSGMPYQSMGDFYISFPGHNNYTDYYRDLDISKAVASVSFKVNGTVFHREVFTSFTNQVVIVRLTADKPGSISCNAFITTPHQKFNITNDSSSLILSGITETHENQSGKVHFYTEIKAKVFGGTHIVKDAVMSISKANEVIFYISMATNFTNYKTLNTNEKLKCVNYLDKAMTVNYDEAKREHSAYYARFFNRVKLDLGTTPAANYPTDERIERFSSSFDPQLAALYFQFGRYLLICASQPGDQPATLQGLWNYQILPPWDCKYTTNINVEMNYWPADVTNLSEMLEPFIQMVRDVSVSGHETARIMYGARGWVLHHNTDIWRITGPVDHAASGMWPSGGAWVCQQLWEHYLYSGNKAYLDSIYPVMKGAAKFFVDFMIPDPTTGYLIVCPSVSPEHVHPGDGGKYSICGGCTMDNQLVFDLYSNVIAASKILKTDSLFADTLRMLRNKISPMRIGHFGQLQEWEQDWDNPNDTHRHVSHLYGVFPSNQISPYRTPELFDAALTSLIHRGDISTGWAMAWRLCLWARFLDGNHAYKLLQDQLSLASTIKKKGGTYPNMLDAHPPFQIDGNFGCTAGIAEMLMQSYDGFIYLLPALPQVWKDGTIDGLKTRGGFTIDMTWKNGKVETLTIHSSIGGNCRLRVKNQLIGKGLKLAQGKNSNPFFHVPDIKKPIISDKAKLNAARLVPTFLYDLKTEAGKSYAFRAKQ